MFGIFFDQETTGLDIRKHGVLEVAFRVISLLYGDVVDSFEAIICPSAAIWDNRDLTSMAVNGLKWEMVRFGKSQEEVGHEITAFFSKYGLVRGKAVFVCQNPSIDRAFFSQLVSPRTQEEKQWPYHWLDLASMYWALEMKKAIAEKRALQNIFLSKDNIANSMNLPPEKKPHRAMQGVDHLLLCYSHVVGFLS